MNYLSVILEFHILITNCCDKLLRSFSWQRLVLRKMLHTFYHLCTCVEYKEAFLVYISHIGLIIVHILQDKIFNGRLQTDIFYKETRLNYFRHHLKCTKQNVSYNLANTLLYMYLVWWNLKFIWIKNVATFMKLSLNSYKKAFLKLHRFFYKNYINQT